MSPLLAALDEAVGSRIITQDKESSYVKSDSVCQ
jgi:hypothetical protein